MLNQIFVEDCLSTMSRMENDSVDLIVTSPPYNKVGLSGGSKSNQIWRKFTIDYDLYGDDRSESEYQDWLVEVLDEMYRVIKPSGSIFFNHKPRRANNRCYLPTDFLARAKATLYQLIVWDRRNSPNIRNDILVPSTEHIYWLSKDKPKTFRDAVSKQFRSEVWVIPASRQDDHPAPFPEQLVRNCLDLTTERNDVVYDPFMGSGTTAKVCVEFGRGFIGSEISPQYAAIARQRIACVTPTLW